MLKTLGYNEGIFDAKVILTPSEMQKVSAAAGIPDEPPERNCAVEGCRIECATTCNQCSGGCNQGPNH